MASTISSHFHALIMAGGKGERFWPWSRENRPKQLLPLFGKETMIKMTVDRLLPLIPKQQIWIVTNAEQARQMSRHMTGFPKSNFVVEPVGRDSAGAVMLGCAMIAREDPQAVMALLPADHLIPTVKTYLKILHGAFEVATRERVLVTIGIKPREPSSAYGYIERGEKTGNLRSTVSMFRVQRFLEKPDPKTACELVKSERFYWNSGMFVWSARAIEDAFKQYSPVHAQGWKTLQKNPRRYLAKGFSALPKISIDYAVMEKARNIRVVEGAFDWDDVGSWGALYHHMPHDICGNASQGNVVLEDSHGCLVLGGGKVIAALGIQDLVVIQTDDALLICRRDAAGRLKDLVKKLPPAMR